MRVSKCVFFMILKRCLTSTIWKVNSNVISLVQIGIQSNSEYTVKGSFVCQTPALLAVRLHQETDRGTNDHTAPHMHLPVVTWIFWSHGFHGNRAIVLTGNEEGCISSLLHYTTTHTHKHTQFVMSFQVWNWSCVMRKRWGVTDTRAAVRTFQERQMSAGKCRDLADILKIVCSLCIRQKLWPATITSLQIIIKVWKYKGGKELKK